VYSHRPRAAAAAIASTRTLPAGSLAEEDIDISGSDVPDLDTLQLAVNRAIERHNMTLGFPS
jgi:hypothetical protein